MPPTVLRVSAVPHVWRGKFIPGKPNGGGNPGPPIGPPPWFNIGFEPAWPSAAYEDVIESMTDWAFSWPISTERILENILSQGRGCAFGYWCGGDIRW